MNPGLEIKLWHCGEKSNQEPGSSGYCTVRDQSYSEHDPPKRTLVQILAFIF